MTTKRRKEERKEMTKSRRKKERKR